MKLIPFEEQKKLVKAAKKGVAVSVFLNVDDLEPRMQRNYYAMLGFNGNETWKTCTILSEITNMLGHYVVVGKNNQIVCGLHGDIFYIEDEEADEDWVD